MKPLLLGTALALVLGSSVSAQDLFRTEVDPTAIVASEFIGKRVYAAEAEMSGDEVEGAQQDWNDIGEINDVILTREGRVDSVLVDIGGFLGMGERQVALSMENIRFVNDGGTAEDMNDFFLVINADRAALEGAPEYVRQNEAMTEGEDAAAMDEAATTGTDTDVAATDGTSDAGTDGELAEGTTTEGAAVEGAADGTMAAEGEVAATDGEVLADDGTAAADGEVLADDGTAATDGEILTNDGTAATEGEVVTDGTVAGTEGAVNPGEGYAQMDVANMTAEELMGVRVYGQNDEDVGEISDIVLDANGKATQIIVDVGGFLGIGEKPVAIDMQQLQIMQETEGGMLRARVDMTQEEIEALPQQE
jgi:sporulation protein YlmC with PRC-barrel domain